MHPNQAMQRIATRLENLLSMIEHSVRISASLSLAIR